MEKVANALNKAVNSNAVINTLLASVFGTLAVRSMIQERTIEALEAEKDALLKTNKGIQRTIWEWKQKLYAEAELNDGKVLVPIARIKAIYGEVVTPDLPGVLSGEQDKQDGKRPAAKIMI